MQLFNRAVAFLFTKQDGERTLRVPYYLKGVTYNEKSMLN